MTSIIHKHYVQEISERIHLKEGKSVIEKALHHVHFYGPVSNQLLAKELLLPIPVVTALKKECIKLGIWTQHNGIQTTDKGRECFLQLCGYDGIDEKLYLELLHSTERQTLLIQELSEKYNSLFQNRPDADVTIDQAKCTVQTAFRRAMLCLTNHSLIGKRILCVGDDDFVSISLALLIKRLFPNRQGYATEIGVFEVDKRFVRQIQELSKTLCLPIKCYLLDLREPLPLQALNYYDCFFTDPPYTVEGASLFLSRGIDALKWERGLRVFLSFGNKPVNGMFSFQKCIQQHGLTVRQIFPAFNEYEGAAILGSISQMFVLETTDQTKSLIPKEKPTKRAIYTGEQRRPESIYICKNCKKIIPLGIEQSCSTIEALKMQGCPDCGQNVFEKRKNSHIPRSDNLSKPLGRQIIADFYGCQTAALHDTKIIREYMLGAARKANATIVEENFHEFEPWGVSGVVVIQESHLAIHTWPDYGYASVDLFTCGETVNPWAAFEYLSAKLQCDNVEYSDISRGYLMDIERFL